MYTYISKYIHIYGYDVMNESLKSLEAILSKYTLIYHFWEVEEVGEFMSCYYWKSNCRMIEKET